MLLRERCSFKRLLAQEDVTSDERRVLDVLRRRASSEQTVYLEECADSRRELAEALELDGVLGASGDGLTRVVDVGCGHGLTSFLLAALRPALRPVWVDSAPSCRAARFAGRLGIECASSTAGVRSGEGRSLVLAVNVCGESLLEVVRWYTDCGEARALLCVPCCGIGEYGEWVNRVEDLMGANRVARCQLKHNLRRTALLHTKLS